MRILFFCWAANFDRVFEDFMHELLRRGNRIHLVHERTKEMPVGAGETIDLLAAAFPDQLSVSLLERRPGPRDLVAARLRRVMDYVRYLEPEFAHAESLRNRAKERLSPRAASLAASLPRFGRKVVMRALRSLERALPVSDEIVAEIERRDPDVVLVSPLVTLASPQADIPPAAAKLHKPTVLMVASWDNLTNKGLVRGALQRTVVWNHGQVDEAVLLHGLPRENVTASGAHAYDHWFGWKPSSSPGEFAEKVGLDGSRPYLLYVCSSAFIAGDESGFVREWLDHIRSAGGPLRDVGVLVRPHPQNTAGWETSLLDQPNVVVWPRAGEVPTGPARKADYFDALFHSRGVVGINTSALIEAAIVRRPVFTVVTDRYRETQEGTLHFAHLQGDLLNVAHSWGEHIQQLEVALGDPDAYRAQIERFLSRFVRPYGLDVAAAPIAADAVEQTAADAVAPARASAAARLLVRAMIARASA